MSTKVYGMNKNTNSYVDQVLLKVTHDADENSIEYKTYLDELRKSKIFEEDDFSLNSIEFDKFYDEGIINA